MGGLFHRHTVLGGRHRIKTAAKFAEAIGPVPDPECVGRIVGHDLHAVLKPFRLSEILVKPADRIGRVARKRLQRGFRGFIEGDIKIHAVLGHRHQIPARHLVLKIRRQIAVDIGPVSLSA